MDLITVRLAHINLHLENVLNNQKDEETETRLHIWCTVGADKPYGKDGMRGAKDGKEWGLKYRDNPEMLDKVNDFEWLENEFRRNT